ncbi:uncharacterized protein EV420DRAFT_1749525 [Desarmillaria tabescens]|uniref:Uncharacterized protein n=1 Tax=Armillaria tabescens TaxID=1929756 RepID=A0AA39N183_ARMTA|nr:uncharacterized protein EV420DRAFT_1749525 [Desarmillaria tabescens]KAK0454217.1 hypothetical protein EV420DRAFT_1749525 [Desarmillaria tabescens]
MAAQANIPSDISDDLKAVILQTLDADLNGTILDSLLQGITAAICTILADSTIGCAPYRYGYDRSNTAVDRIKIIGHGTIWRCWTVWGRRWLLILPPILSLIAAVGMNTQLSAVFKSIATYQLYVFPDDYPHFFTPYSSCVLATTLWCTLLIIYQIVTVALAAGEAGGGLRAYRHVLEVLIESSALYSIALILCTAFFARNTISIMYLDALAAIARGIAPTLLVGRVAAGHARPDDSWQGSVISGSLRFGSHSGVQSSGIEDLEAQRERGDEYSHRTLADSEEDIGVESAECIILEDLPKARVGKRADGYLIDEDGIRVDRRVG